jgi:Cu-Zn family superoxide dismutase
MVGKVEVAQNEDGVTFTVLLDAGALPEGEHGMHVHETGSCAQGGDSAFALANAHYNPTDQHHGALTPTRATAAILEISSRQQTDRPISLSR